MDRRLFLCCTWLCAVNLAQAQPMPLPPLPEPDLILPAELYAPQAGGHFAQDRPGKDQARSSGTAWKPDEENKWIMDRRIPSCSAWVPAVTLGKPQPLIS